ncbi:hypothetical protein ACXIUS_28985 [Bosea thiooxidans]
MSHYQYSAGDHPDYHDEFGRFDFPKEQNVYGENWWLVATDLAEDYHHNHDGWEASWPLELRIYKDAAEVARFSVEREIQPVFYAYDLPVAA